LGNKIVKILGIALGAFLLSVVTSFGLMILRKETNIGSKIFDKILELRGSKDWQGENLGGEVRIILLNYLLPFSFVIIFSVAYWVFIKKR
jgi:hypothetical protein